MTRHITATLYGLKAGPSWDGQVCTKHFSRNLTRYSGERRGTFLKELFRICRDGDFQNCKLSSDSVLEIKMTKERPGGRTVTLTRDYLLGNLPSAADFVYDEPF